MEKKKIAVLISGTGSNFKAIYEAYKKGEVYGEIVCVISDNSKAPGLQFARDAGISTYCVAYKHEERTLYEDLANNMSSYLSNCVTVALKRLPQSSPLWNLSEIEMAARVIVEDKILEILRVHEADLLIGAGYMKLLTPHLLSKFQPDPSKPKVMNIHPALLPSFPGKRGYADAFEYGVEVHGATVHFMDYGEDTGPIIGQSHFERLPSDNLETFSGRGLRLEWRLYVRCVQLFCLGLLDVRKNEVGRYIVHKLPGSENVPF